eukprot:CAMPEP_0116043216 /NCGR_PEP_ID=MMETSP0321-20121206/26207_1 /TAXON_ID=163516 /ORGANISM="Leptocylindrus danicus var. danicus, Strain B650" /LENGTH=46 /DNA_ID= /DNA_START= /DNA_END= /DNA_ORIENTATION=
MEDVDEIIFNYDNDKSKVVVAVLPRASSDRLSQLVTKLYSKGKGGA